MCCVDAVYVCYVACMNVYVRVFPLRRQMLSRLSYWYSAAVPLTTSQAGRQMDEVWATEPRLEHCLHQVLDDSMRAGKCNPKIPRTELALGK